MQVALWPFWSQQSKDIGAFLPTCGNVKQLRFLQEALRAAGHRTNFATPAGCLADPHDVTITLPLSNPLQRVHWDIRDIQRVCSGADALVTSSEYLAIPARAAFPKLRIIQMCNVSPDDMLFIRAWEAADLVAVQNECSAYLPRSLQRPTTVWRMAYDERDWVHAGSLPRDIDVVFVQRCSADNSTHHEEYLRTGLVPRTVFTDVTHFLRMSRPELRYCTPATYALTLLTAKVAVSMHASWYGGLSIREAIRAGCTPVVLRSPGYVELLGSDWPYYCTPDDVESIVERALAAPVVPQVIDESYQANVRKCVEDVCRS